MALREPFPLSQVSQIVRAGYIGVYILSRNGSALSYVGRSDADLQGRIISSASESNYRAFYFDYASSPMDAYKYECELYHKFKPPDNQNHPHVPEGTNWRCPVRGCPWS